MKIQDITAFTALQALETGICTRLKKSKPVCIIILRSRSLHIKCNEIIETDTFHIFLSTLIPLLHLTQAVCTSHWKNFISSLSVLSTLARRYGVDFSARIMPLGFVRWWENSHTEGICSSCKN